MGSSASIPEPERTELNQQIALVIKSHEELYGKLTYIHPNNEPVMDFSTSVSGSELTQHLALTIENHEERFGKLTHIHPNNEPVMDSSTSIPESRLTEITQYLALFIKNHEQRHGKLTHIHPPSHTPNPPTKAPLPQNPASTPQTPKPTSSLRYFLEDLAFNILAEIILQLLVRALERLARLGMAYLEEGERDIVSEE